MIDFPSNEGGNCEFVSKINTVILVSLLFLSYSPSLLNANDTEKEYTTFFKQEWLKTVVSIERAIPVPDKPDAQKSKAEFQYKPKGTGFLVGSTDNRLFLVTAKHVILKDDGVVRSDLVYRMNLKSGRSILVHDSQCLAKGLGPWLPSKTSDVAIRLVFGYEKDDTLHIPQELFLKREIVGAGTPALILGFPMGMR